MSKFFRDVCIKFLDVVDGLPPQYKAAVLIILLCGVFGLDAPFDLIKQLS